MLLPNEENTDVHRREEGVNDDGVERTGDNTSNFFPQKAIHFLLLDLLSMTMDNIVDNLGSFCWYSVLKLVASNFASQATKGGNAFPGTCHAARKLVETENRG